MTPIEILKRAGLSSHEARAYISLLREGKADALTIAKKTGIPYSKIYTVMKHLREMGFVEVDRTRPRIYYPISPEKVKALLRRRMEERWEALGKLFSEHLLPLFNGSRASEKGEFEIIYDMDLAAQRLLNLIMASKMSIEALIPDVSEENFEYIRLLLEALRRTGLTLKILAAQEISKYFSNLKKNYDIRVTGASPIGLVISDTRQLLLIWMRGDKITALSTENPTLIEMASKLFNTIWGKATPLEDE